MIRAAFAVVLTIGATSACLPKPNIVGPFVRSIVVENGVLVIEKCMIQLYREELFAKDCVVERTPLPNAANPAVSEP